MVVILIKTFWVYEKDNTTLWHVNILVRQFQKTTYWYTMARLIIAIDAEIVSTKTSQQLMTL